MHQLAIELDQSWSRTRNNKPTRLARLALSQPIDLETGELLQTRARLDAVLDKLPIALTDLTVSDPDHSYPRDFTLRLLRGANYTTEGNTVVPAPDFDGDLAVPVVVNDGVDDSAPATS